jgi:hypothetical protein
VRGGSYRRSWKTAALGLGFLAAALATAWPGPAAGSACVQVVNRVGSETLVNTCGVCRSVSIIRSRQGHQTPTQRTFRVLANATFDLPFKGSGASRITGDEPCEGAPGAAVNLVNPKQVPASDTTPTCVELYQLKDGAVAMLNACNACRSVTVARVGTQGGETRQIYALAARTPMALEALGAASARIVGETACK